MAQQHFPVNDRVNPPIECGWCSEPAVDEVMLEKPRYRMDVKDGKKVKVLAKSPIMAGVCHDHKDILDKQPTADKPDTYKVD